jgi:hypothetical protein
MGLSDQEPPTERAHRHQTLDGGLVSVLLMGPPLLRALLLATMRIEDKQDA